jgi:stress response protein SCP2
MALNVISKGKSMNLSVQPKVASSGLNVKPKSLLEEIRIKAGWDEVSASGGGFFGAFKAAIKSNVDVDIFAGSFDDAGRIVDKCFYGQKSACNGAIRHSGDNLTGKDDPNAEKISSEGLTSVNKAVLFIDEQLTIKLQDLPSNVTKIVVGLNIYQAKERNQSFDSIRNCFMAIADGNNTNQALIDLGNKSGTGFIAIKIVKDDAGTWTMVNIDQETNGTVGEVISAGARM